MTEKYIARMKRIQANRRRWATKESEGFFNKINRLVEKAEQEMIDEKEKFAKLTDPENTDNVSQILAELDDLSLRKTLENAGKSHLMMYTYSQKEGSALSLACLSIKGHLSAFCHVILSC